MWIAADQDTVWVHAFGHAWTLTLIDPVQRALGDRSSEDLAHAPMPGTVITVAVQAGQRVVEGERLVVIESMKMQSEIVARARRRRRDRSISRSVRRSSAARRSWRSFHTTVLRTGRLMLRLESHVDKASATFRAYREHNLALAAELRETLDRVRHERPQRALDRLAEQHKLTVRERLACCSTGARHFWS